MKRSLQIIGGCLFLLLLLFFAVDPNKIPSFMLILPFILLFILLFVGIKFLLEKQGMGQTKRTRLAGLCSSLPILLLVLQSIGQLTVRDILTVALLFVISYFYIVRATASS